MGTTVSPRSPARSLALVVSALFAISPAAIGAVLPPDQSWTWQLTVVSVAYVTGAACLGAGAVRWYGASAQRLRLAGFIVLLVAALVNISLAFILVPLSLLAALSLRRHDDRGGG